MSAVALVPAYNEELIIERTVRSLMSQTYPFELILVIANNCTDRTVEIVKRLQEEFGPVLQLLVMEKNDGLKAGALNWGFAYLNQDAYDFVFSMDGDTVLHEGILAEGIKKFAREPKTGGICSAYRTLPLSKDATFAQRFMWRIQNIEFGLANAWRIENHRSARVLPGVSSLYRMDVLKKIAETHGDGKVWVVNNRVEDYILTLEIKDMGWDAKSSHDMISWSDVPLDIKSLWKQRERWYSGTIDVLRDRGLKKHSRYELFTINLLMLNLFLRTLLYGTYATLLMTGVHVQWVSYFLVLPALTIALQLYRLKYADQLDRWQKFFTATLVVNELYALFREINYAYSIWLSFFRPKRGW
jgi:biofilm PGA synthesis N-glycosyltransferase PgaC